MLRASSLETAKISDAEQMLYISSLIRMAFNSYMALLCLNANLTSCTHTSYTVHTKYIEIDTRYSFDKMDFLKFKQT